VIRLLIPTLVSFAFMACNSASQRAPASEPTQFLLSSNDFDLEAVIGLIKGNKIKDAADLEKQINAGNAINNVDMDHDGKIDYIKVKENRNGSNMTFDFLAIPSSSQNEAQGKTVASITFSQNQAANNTQIQGGYPNYVQGYNQNYYNTYMPHQGLSFGDALFLAWIFSPGRSMYYHPYAPVVYIQRPVIIHQDLQARRSFFRKDQAIAEVKPQPKPAPTLRNSSGTVRPFERRPAPTQAKPAPRSFFNQSRSFSRPRSFGRRR